MTIAIYFLNWSKLMVSLMVTICLQHPHRHHNPLQRIPIPITIIPVIIRDSSLWAQNMAQLAKNPTLRTNTINNTHTPTNTSSMGTVGAVRNCTWDIMSRNTCLMLVAPLVCCLVGAKGGFTQFRYFFKLITLTLSSPAKPLQ